MPCSMGYSLGYRARRTTTTAEDDFSGLDRYHWGGPQTFIFAAPEPQSRTSPPINYKLGANALLTDMR